MKINKYWFWELPQKKLETVVVIDTNAATTNFNLILNKKPNRLIIVNEKNLFQVQDAYPNSLVIGESLSLPAKIFKVSNHPSEIMKYYFKGENILYMSINGTRVLEGVLRKTKSVIGCAFNNLAFVKKWLLQRKVKEVTIVMSGDITTKVTEDLICAELLEKEIKGKIYDWKRLKEQVMNFILNYYGTSKNEKNLPYILDLNAYNIIPTAENNTKGFLEVQKVSARSSTG